MTDGRALRYRRDPSRHYCYDCFFAPALRLRCLLDTEPHYSHTGITGIDHRHIPVREFLHSPSSVHCWCGVSARKAARTDAPDPVAVILIKHQGTITG